MATLTGGTGNDSLSGAGDNDIITGGAGNDTLSGGIGSDSIVGSAETATTVSGVFSWSSLGKDESNLNKTQTAVVSGMTVSVGFTQDTGRTAFSVESSESGYVAPSETFVPASNLEIEGPGNGQSTVTVNFAPATGGGMESAVQNVSFRLNDIDAAGWQDRITIRAYDANGNLVPVTITASGNDTVSGATITAGGTSDLIGSAQGSALVQIAGPVARIEIVTNNLGASAQVVYVSDIQFSSVRVDNDMAIGGADSDTLTGGYGNDTLRGDDGNDALYGGTGNDSLVGGAGNDTLAGGTGNDVIDGGLGNDIVDYSASTAAVSVNLGTGAVLGGHAQGDTLAAVDGVIGSAFNDTLTGYDQQSVAANDSYTNALYGGAGNDLIDGAGGNDLLYGGTGNDTVAGGSGDDLVDGGNGDDSLTGDAGNDTLTGGDGADSLFGGTGDDVLWAGAGDSVDGGAGTDRLDLSGLGPVRVLRDAQVAGSGTVQFLNAQRQVIGSLAYQNVETVVPCFTPGCRIATAKGAVPVETLQIGDRVRVRDGDFATLRWVGRRKVSAAELAARPDLTPVEIAVNALGPNLPRRRLIVSPQHRILFSGAACQLLFGEDEVLVPALHLLGIANVRRLAPLSVDYLHFMFDRHEVVKSNGLWTESFQPGDMTLAGLDDAQRSEVLGLFPELRNPAHAARQAARPSLRAHESALLLHHLALSVAA